MTNIYGNLANLFDRIANLSPERQKLLELLIEQDQMQLMVKHDNINGLKLEHFNQGVSNSGKSLQPGFYEIHWRPLAVSKLEQPIVQRQNHQSGRWLLFADQGGVAEALAKRIEAEGDRCTLVFLNQAYECISQEHFSINPSELSHFKRLLSEIPRNNHAAYRGIIHLWSLDQLAEDNSSLKALQNTQLCSCGSVLHLIQALNQAGWVQSPRLWLVTRGAMSVGTVPEPVQVQQAPLWGLGRAIALEHPEWQCVCLDLGQFADGNDTQVLFQEVWFSSREDQVAWRHGVRHVPRLVRRTSQATVTQPLVNPNSSYLITGGLGALGLKVAHWLVTQGARHLVLIGRREPSAEAHLSVSHLEEAGANVLLVKGDVSSVIETSQIIDTVKVSLPPLRGIIHAAGVLDDGVLQQLSWERFERVMAPKVAGAWNLHQLTQDVPLDFFVCFSSIVSLLGNAGQGNYGAANSFLDALAYHRRALGLPGLTINWGPWAEVGMAARLESRQQSRMAAHGLGTIPLNQGLQSLAELLGQGAIQIGVIPIDWSTFLQQFPASTYPALVSDLACQLQQPTKSDRQGESPLDLKAQLPQASAQERQELLVAYLQDLVSKFLGLAPSRQPKPHQSLSELGIDSLVAIQLRNRIRTELKLDVPMEKFTGEAAIAQLAKTLLEQLTLASLILSEAPSTDLSEDMEEIKL